MRINELFTGGADWHWIGKARGLTKAKFTVDKANYEVWFAGENVGMEGVHIGFMLQRGENFSMSVTGTGNASTVLATVVSVIKAYVEENQPNEFHFSSSDRMEHQEGKKNSRTVLYDRMANRLAGLAKGYTLSNFRDGGQAHWSFQRKEPIREGKHNCWTIYRGEYSGNRGGRFWTQDKEFARQFTQSGQDKEIMVRYILSGDIKNCHETYAGDPDAVDAVAAQAKEEGYKAVMLNEGRGEPNSIWVFDKSALMRQPS